MKKNLIIGVTVLVIIVVIAIIVAIVLGIKASKAESNLCVNNQHRPQFHFSPFANWINDPNGMVYYKGEYHLFFQYHPESTIWGPMYWGSAVSTDLFHWNELPIALYPDELGMIFSGSAVVDTRNTSGLQESNDENVIVAIFTHAGDTQQQSIAFSNDRGRQFVKYVGNPVIANPGVPDFRDPKVTPYNDKWIMALAVNNKIQFFESTDLKSWVFISEFGNDPTEGSHGGVWECPELIPLEYNGATLWILLVSINPGGPNRGSATQYFVGHFNGTTFETLYPGGESHWIDWGQDNYAGVTFANEPNSRSILMGWMNNWLYAEKLPTNQWRGQMTLPRVLQLQQVEGNFRLVSIPVPELSQLRNVNQLYAPPVSASIPNGTNVVLTQDAPFVNPLLEVDITLEFEGLVSFGICFYNNLSEEICFGYEHALKQYFLDRTKSGSVDFQEDFKTRAIAPREVQSNVMTLKIFLDVSSLEVFADGGLTVMTDLFFPSEPFVSVEIRHYSLEPTDRLGIDFVQLQGLNSIYNC